MEYPNHITMNEYLAVLRRRPGYLRLWIAQAVSLLGDWFTTIALSALVVRYSNGSGLAVSGLLLARFLPPLLVGPFAGVLVDRLNRKMLLIISDSVRVVVVLGFLLATGPENLWLIYLLSTIQFSFSSLFEPCRSALIPSLVEPDELVVANTLGSVTWSVMLAVGAVIGGAVTTLVGAPLALIIDASTFAISALLIASIRVASRPVTETHHESLSGLHGLIEGLRCVAVHPTTAAVLLVKLGGNIGNIDLLMVIYATQLFVIGENGTGSLGLLYATFGVGAILGPLLLNRFNDHSVPRMRRLIVIGYICLALGWFLLGGAPTLTFAAFAIFVRAMGGSVYWTYSSVIIQKEVPDEYLGRVFSLDQTAFLLATVISAWATGLLIDHVGRGVGIQLDTAIRMLSTGQLTYLAQIGGIRRIVIGTGIVSLIPLILWSLAIPWMDRKELVAQPGVISSAGE
jgi:MFS family permease